MCKPYYLVCVYVLVGLWVGELEKQTYILCVCVCVAGLRRLQMSVCVAGLTGVQLCVCVCVSSVAAAAGASALC